MFNVLSGLSPLFLSIDSSELAPPVSDANTPEMDVWGIEAIEGIEEREIPAMGDISENGGSDIPETDI